MNRIKKILNLYRLDLKNKCIVLLYFSKSILKMQPTQNEIDIYKYYNNLILSDGYLFAETQNSFTSDFKNNVDKRIKLRKRPSSDMYVFQQIYHFEEYLPLVNMYKDNFKNNIDYKMNIIDAGSNIGLTSLFFMDHFNKPNVICIEPEIQNFKILEYNIDGNNDSNIIKINGAVWSSNSKIKIIKDFRDKLEWSFRVEETQEMDGILAYSINQLVKDNSFEYLDILKIDVEGSEKQIFNKALSNLDFLKITKCIAIEIHDEFNCREDIYTVLDEYGFSYFNKGELTIGVNKNLLT